MLRRLAKPRLGVASATSAFAAICVAAALFVVFRISAELTSLAAIGCWSLVQGVFLVSRITEAGAGANVTRITVLYRNEKTYRALSVFLAGAAVNVLPTIILGFLLVAPTRWFITGQVDAATHLTDAVPTLVWMALLNAGVGATSSITGAMVEGHGALVLRNLIVIVSNLISAGSAYFLIGRLGVVGIAAVTLLTTSLQLVMSTVALPFLSGEQAKPHSTTQVIRHIWRESMGMSVAGIVRLSFEPITKILIAHGGALAAVAVFEFALRLATQFRIVFQGVAQPLLYAGSRASDHMPEGTKALFDRVQQLISLASCRLSEPQLLLVPLISYVSFGSIRADFAVFYVALLIANAVNMLGLVGYYYQLSSGAMGKIVRMQAIMALINLILGIALTAAFGAIGAVLGYCVAFIYGGLAAMRFPAWRHNNLVSDLLSYWSPLSILRLIVMIALTGVIVASTCCVAPALLMGAATLLAVIVGLSGLLDTYRQVLALRRQSTTATTSYGQEDVI